MPAHRVAAGRSIPVGTGGEAHPADHDPTVSVEPGAYTYDECVACAERR